MIRLFLLALTLVAAPAAAMAFSSDRITVEVRGIGPDVVLIPGLASSPAVWSRTAERLDDDHRVHLVGVRGFATREGMANESGALSEPVAAELARYLAEAEVRDAAVVGHSLGGQIALRLARLAPDRVGRVMVVDSLPFFGLLLDPRARGEDLAGPAELARAAILFLGDEAFRSGGGAAVAGLMRAGDGLLGSLGLGGDGDRRVLAQGVYEVLTEDFRPQLPAVHAPVTVVYAWNPDMEITREGADTLFGDSFEGLPRVQFERVDDTAHMIMLDQPARFEQALTRFLGRPPR